VKQYKEDMLALLNTLSIAPPDHIAMDQKQIQQLITSIKAAVDKYDPTPAATGDAEVTDVLAGKTFSNAGGVDLEGVLTVADLTADATAVAADIAPGKTAYTADGLVSGTSPYDRICTFEAFAVNEPFTEAATAQLLALNSNAVLVMAHGTDSYKFIPLARSAEQDKIYLIGATASSTGAFTVYRMEMTVADSVATISSVKDSDDVEQLADWLEDQGTLIIYAE
jgi:hypothetical protein